MEATTCKSVDGQLKRLEAFSLFIFYIRSVQLTKLFPENLISVKRENVYSNVATGFWLKSIKHCAWFL